MGSDESPWEMSWVGDHTIKLTFKNFLTNMWSNEARQEMFKLLARVQKEPMCENVIIITKFTAESSPSIRFSASVVGTKQEMIEIAAILTDVKRVPGYLSSEYRIPSTVETRLKQALGLTKDG